MTISRILLRPTTLSSGHVYTPRSVFLSNFVKCMDNTKSGLGGSGGGDTNNNNNMVMNISIEKWKTLGVKAIAASSSRRLAATETHFDHGGGLDLGAWIAAVRDGLLKINVFRPGVKQKTGELQLQFDIEKGIINCRFFTLFAVAGSLLGSALCFLEGLFLTLESYFEHLKGVPQNPDQGDMVHLLIDAIDMFLVGTSMFMFGVGLYAMFVASKNPKAKVPYIPTSNFFGLFPLKSLPTWLNMQSVTQAKSRIGHAVMMILQVGLLEKFKDVPFVTSLDLACFAGALFVSSACIFLLSKLSFGGVKQA